MKIYKTIVQLPFYDIQPGNGAELEPILDVPPDKNHMSKVLQITRHNIRQVCYDHKKPTGHLSSSMRMPGKSRVPANRCTCLTDILASLHLTRWLKCRMMLREMCPSRQLCRTEQTVKRHSEHCQLEMTTWPDQLPVDVMSWRTHPHQCQGRRSFFHCLTAAVLPTHNWPTTCSTLLHTIPYQVLYTKAEVEGFYITVDTQHVVSCSGDVSFLAIDCTTTDNKKQRHTIRRPPPTHRWHKHNLQNTGSVTFYSILPKNGVSLILRVQEPACGSYRALKKSIQP